MWIRVANIYFCIFSNFNPLWPYCSRHFFKQKRKNIPYSTPSAVLKTYFLEFWKIQANWHGTTGPFHYGSWVFVKRENSSKRKTVYSSAKFPNLFPQVSCKFSPIDQKYRGQCDNWTITQEDIFRDIKGEPKKTPKHTFLKCSVPVDQFQ